MILRLVAFVFLGIVPQLLAGESNLQVITLRDRSVLRARVTEMSGGVYLVKSPVLGEMRIPTGDVLSIRDEGTIDPGTVTPEPGPTARGEAGTGLTSRQPSDLTALQAAVTTKVQDLVSTPGGMNALMEFSKNPEVKAVMNDPHLMQCIKNGDHNALMNSPALKQLLDNPQTRDFIQSVMKPKPAGSPSLAPAGSPSPTK